MNVHNVKYPKDRQPYWDNLKGILIFLVVVGHFFWQYKDENLIKGLTYLIYSFHMPAFLFVSGFFSKSFNEIKFRSLLSLLVAFILINYSMMFYAHYVDGQPFSVITLYYSSWYLLAIFLYRLIHPLFSRVPFIVPISILVSLGVGYLWILDNMWQLQKIITLYPFFIIGAKVSKQKVAWITDSSNKRWWIGWFVLLTIASTTTWLIYTQYLGYDQILWSSYNIDNGLLMRSVGMTIALIWVFALLYITPSSHLPLITKWGKNSLSIYVTHRIVTLIFNCYYPSFNNDYFEVFVLVTVALVTLIVLGMDKLDTFVNDLFKKVVEFLVPSKSAQNLNFKFVCFLAIGCVLFGAIAAVELSRHRKESIKRMYRAIKAQILTEQKQQDQNHFLAQISKEQLRSVENAVSLSFVGDLILLRDQVYKAYDPKSDHYDFSALFEYTRVLTITPINVTKSIT